MMDQRSMAVLNQLLLQDSYISIQELADKLNVSRRSIYNDLEKVNDWLNGHDFPEIQQVRAQGLYLDELTKKEILKSYSFSEISYYEFSPDERKAWIYIHIVGQEDPYFLEDVRELFQVSRNTALDDIKRLKNDLEAYRLQVTSERKNGYQIIGNEDDIRRVLIHFLSQVIPKEGWYSLTTDLENSSKRKNDRALEPYKIFDVSLLNQLRGLLNEYETRYNVELTDDILNNIVVWFHFFIKRIMQQEIVEVDPIEKDIIQETDEYVGAEFVCNSISETLTILIPTNEIYYFAMYLLSAKVNYKSSPRLKGEEIKALSSVVEKMVADFQKYAAIEFRSPEQMIQNLMLHLKPAYYRIKYGIDVENTLRESVMKNYPEVFHITKKVVHHFEDIIGKRINDNEVAFITMHFGGWLRKEGVTLDHTRKKMLIVCTNGLGTSRLLESQLEGLISDVQVVGVTSLREYEKMALQVDFIVSTIPLPDKGVPVFVVNPVLNNEDKEQLLKKVNSLFEQSSKKQIYSVDTVMDIVRRYAKIEDSEALSRELRRYFYSPKNTETEILKPSLSELLPRERIISKRRVTNWEDAIRFASKPLLNQGFITGSYIEKMILNITKLGPYVVISDNFALPHANPEDGVHKTGMSMLLLEEPVNMLGKMVRVLVVLASRDNEQHLRALQQLTKLLSDKEDQKVIMNTTDRSRMISLIQAYSTTQINNKE
jgi:mannitol operon transcriptional antiterminator